MERARYVVPGHLLKQAIPVQVPNQDRPHPAKPLSSTHHKGGGVTKTTEPLPRSSNVKKVPSSESTGGHCGYGGNVRGSGKDVGDDDVDKKATSYILKVKERIRLEELKILNEKK
ncbi:unnamed protein product [Cuscuta epithymum]|uniref:Uncharacterized protein n=1 Tax=Cuscuta epithymum TaxID=186058 RepID=A0AAV0DBQ4_9ASTE|nr:unnamed protein product [Cuscuta epithymum]